MSLNSCSLEHVPTSSSAFAFGTPSVSSKQKRFLLFSNNLTAGIFPADKTTTITKCVIISSNGEFVHVSCGGDSRTHLTRFVPSEFEKQTAELLVFRNSLLSKPYLCRRFNDAIANEFCGDELIRFSNSSPANFPSSGESRKKIIVTRGENSISLIGFDRILTCTQNVSFWDDDVSGRSSSFSQKIYCQVSSYFPLARAPEHLSRILLQADDDALFREILIPLPENCGAKESKEALSMFEMLAPELTLFLETNRFSKSFQTVAECVDDAFIYVLNEIDKSTSSAQVECWLLRGHDLSSVWEVQTLISLKGDIFKVQRLIDGEELESEVHVSLLDLVESSDDIENDVFTETIEIDAGDSKFVLLNLVEQASHLLGLKNHIEEFAHILKQEEEICPREKVQSLRSVETVTHYYTRKTDDARFMCMFDGKVRGLFKDRTILEIRPNEEFYISFYSF